MLLCRVGGGTKWGVLGSQPTVASPSPPQWSYLLLGEGGREGSERRGFLARLISLSFGDAFLAKLRTRDSGDIALLDKGCSAGVGESRMCSAGRGLQVLVMSHPGGGRSAWLSLPRGLALSTLPPPHLAASPSQPQSWSCPQAA